MNRFVLLLIAVLFVTSCKTTNDSVKPLPQVSSGPSSEPSEIIPLSWNQPEWSGYLIKLIDDNFEAFDMAKDATKFCSNYASLSHADKVKMWAEMIVWTSYYESSWNPKSASKDVGTNDKNTWSIGLMQISQVDQKNLKIPLSYTYDQLLTPKPNLELAVAIIVRQLKLRGKILLDNSDSQRYFATLLFSNRYSQITNIVSKTKKAVGCK